MVRFLYNFFVRYFEMLKVDRGEFEISAYTRQFESQIRLAEAYAYVSLSEDVEELDVEEVKR